MANDLIQAADGVLKDRSLISRFNAGRFDKGMKWAAEKQYALQILQGNEQLQRCDPASFQLALLDVAFSGLTLNPRLQHGFLIPYTTTVTFSPGYRGLAHLAHRAGTVKSIQTARVLEGDQFKVYVRDNIRHVEHVETGKKRGPDEVALAAYCIAHYMNGGQHVETMYREELERAEAASRMRSEKGGKVWRKGMWRGEMEKKAVLRRASKHWPLDPAGIMAHLHEVSSRFDDAPLPEGKEGEDDPQELCVSTDQIRQLHALVASEMTGAEADKWLQNTALAMGYTQIEALPAKRYSEMHDRLKARMDKVRERKSGG